MVMQLHFQKKGFWLSFLFFANVKNYSNKIYNYNSELFSNLVIKFTPLSGEVITDSF